MNKPIRTISLFCLLLFLALMINATYLQYWKAGALNDDPRNRRVITAAFSRERGAILVGRDPVAQSVKSGDRYKYQRKYPKPFEYAPLTGFFSFYSQTGVEQTENDVLSGDDSKLFVNNLVGLLSNDSAKGGNVELTIDPAAQDAAWNGLKALGPNVQGAVVAIEPNTGKILAMTSTPTYDPNKLASHDLSSVLQTYSRLQKDPAQPMINRAIQTVLPPGSTFKLVTASAALESGNFDPQSRVPGGTSLDLPQTSKDLHNENGVSCGGSQITLTRALDVSCNVSFGWLGLQIGGDALRQQAQKYGFGQHYFDDLPQQAISRFPSGDLAPPFEAYSAIGQYEVAATPLQMAMVGAGIANRGTVMKPYLVDEVQSSDYDVLDKTQPSELSKAVSPQTAAELTQMMVSVVDQGTGTPAQIPGISVAGKTGTAQSTPSRPPYAWFVSFAPANDAKVAVAVLVQSSDTARSEIAGSALCAPIAKAVMQAVLQ
ncbi:peptidoglycan D,D-transpeptidase FtsI family protein [Nocardioides panaciterrulae]|uniref:Peptidoglycan glycosyltransferase n=1 Tax=Nocardioides panaciterrulae TaxID=661492 RepID=A0A7Y9E2Q7_9ACTN|nr:penicillin-binding protein 2 [Nocardioides panaciterrulae]NYD39960.1 peptidoglycan glycosyltransferase [Nocardioides panaciterrulae]